MPNLQFLKKADVTSLTAVETNIFALDDAASWFAAAAATAKGQMELAREIQESCKRVVDNVRALKAMRAAGMDVASENEAMAAQSEKGGANDEEGDVDYLTTLKRAKENFDHLRVLRAKWHAGGKNLEDVSGIRQSRWIRSARTQMVDEE